MLTSATRTTASSASKNSSDSEASGPRPVKSTNIPTLSNNSKKKRGDGRKKIPYEDRMASTTASCSSLGGASGYLADLEQKLSAASPLPASIDLMSRSPKRALLGQSSNISTTNDQGDSKRPKRTPPTKEELNFMASAVERDLQRGGVKRQNCSSVNMKSVTLLHSKTLDKSPFLLSHDVSSPYLRGNMVCPSTLNEILNETRCFYRHISDLPPLPVAFSKVVESIQVVEDDHLESTEEQANSSDSESSTSSFTSSDAAETSEYVPRDAKISNSDTDILSDADVAPSQMSAVVSIGEALSFTSHPKYVHLHNLEIELF